MIKRRFYNIYSVQIVLRSKGVAVVPNGLIKLARGPWQIYNALMAAIGSGIKKCFLFWSRYQPASALYLVHEVLSLK